MKTYTLEDGRKVQSLAPSAHFNPLTASSAELQKNGFPAVPEQGEHRDRFVRVFSLIKNKYHYVEPTFRVNKDRSHGRRMRAKAAGSETSTNWSGAVVTAGGNGTRKARYRLPTSK